MIEIKQKENESRKDFLVRLAIEYIEVAEGYVPDDCELYYDEAVCDGSCLAEDLRTEFDID